MRKFESMARDRFAEELVVHLRRFSPQRCGMLDLADLNAAVGAGIQRANAYGFTRRGPIRLFIEAAVLLGSEFDGDPMHPAIASRLQAHGDEMVRADRIHAELLRYRAEVTGADGGRLRDGLTALLDVAHGTALGLDDPSASTTLVAAFPAKAAYVGREGLQGLIRRATLEAASHNFATPRSRSVLLVTMFALGHGVTRDWSYPAVQQALAGACDAEARSARFEFAALAELARARVDVAGGSA